MDREIDILNYIPDFIKQFSEFRELASAENPEILCLWDVLQNVLRDQFVSDFTENGIERWETILKIAPMASESLEARKFRILARLNQKLPYTYKTLEQQLSTLCGDSSYQLELKSDEYRLIVRVALSVKSIFDEVAGLLKRIVPANMIVDISLMYNQQLSLASRTHAWLSGYTHEQLRSEVF